MPPREDDEYGLEPAKKAGTAVADDDYGLEKAGGAAAASEEATEENLPGSTPQLRAAVNKGVAKMKPPTKFEQENPQMYDFPEKPRPMELQEYAGLPSRHVLGAIGEGIKGVVGSGLQGAYDITFGEPNKETGEIEHGPGGLIGLNAQGEFAPKERLAALTHKYISEPAAGEIEKAKTEPSDLASAGHTLAAAVPLVGPWAAHLGERAGAGDVTGAAGEAVGGVLGGEMMGHPIETAKAAGAIGKAGVRAGFDALGNPLGMGLEGHELLTKGVRPRARAQGWQDAIQSPGVQRAIIDANAQVPIKNVEDFHDAIDPMKQKLWKENVQPSIDRQGPKPVDMKPAADNIRGAITPEMRKFDPNGVAQLETLANQLDESRTVAEADRLQKYANSQLESYFGKYPSARRSAFATNPETMGWELARRGIREGLIKAMDEVGESEYAPGRSDYGHLITLEKELERKINPNERKAPTGLYNFLGSAAGLGALLTGHGPLAGAMYGFGKLAEHFNKPDVLIQRGIKNLNPPKAAPFTAPPPYFTPLEQFPETQGAHPPSTAPVQGPPVPPKPFALENLRPNQTAMWQQQVGAPPPLETGAPTAPYREPIGPEPAREGLPAPIQGEQQRFHLPETPEEAPLWNLRPINVPKNVGEPVAGPPAAPAAPEAPAPVHEGPLRPISQWEKLPDEAKDAIRTNNVATTNLARTGVEDLKVGDTFIDDKGEPRRIVNIKDGKIETADGSARTFAGEIDHRGELNSPRALLARGGMFIPGAGEGFTPEVPPIGGYEERVRKYEDEGLTRSDAQGVVDAENARKTEAKLGEEQKGLKLGKGEDLGPGLGTEHVITREGKRVGSVTVEPRPDGVLHVHWLGGEFTPADRGPLTSMLKGEYPDTERITYDRRRLGKEATAATTEPRKMRFK